MSFKSIFGNYNTLKESVVKTLLGANGTIPVFGVNGTIDTTVALSTLATVAYVDSKMPTNSPTYATTAYVDERINSINLSAYALTTTVNNQFLTVNSTLTSINNRIDGLTSTIISLGNDKANRQQAPWITLGLRNSVTSTTNSYYIASFTKDEFGYALLRGNLLIPGQSGSVNQVTIGYMPSGYRPNKNVVFPLVNGFKAAKLEVLPTGEIIYYSDTMSQHVAHIDYIRFQADGTNTTTAPGETPTFNSTKQYTAYCPEGSHGSSITAIGYGTGSTQAIADSNAVAAAKTEAERQLVCNMNLIEVAKSTVGYIDIETACLTNLSEAKNYIYSEDGTLQVGTVLYWNATGTSKLTGSAYYKTDGDMVFKVSNSDGIVTQINVPCPNQNPNPNPNEPVIPPGGGGGGINPE
jgi:hypothetical protein